MIPQDQQLTQSVGAQHGMGHLLPHQGHQFIQLPSHHLVMRKPVMCIEPSEVSLASPGPPDLMLHMEVLSVGINRRWDGAGQHQTGFQKCHEHNCHGRCLGVFNHAGALTDRSVCPMFIIFKLPIVATAGG